MCLRLCFLCLLLACLPMVLFGQTNRVTVSGRVLDASTGEPLPGANVYLSQTLLGSSTDIDGSYTITGIPLGTYEMVASMIGYQPMRNRIQIETDQPYEHPFSLEPVVVNLSEIEVVDARPKNWKKHVKRFNTLFLGTTQNAESCTLTNPENLNIEEASRNTFVVSASQPLLIENKALGYRISYLLDSFKATSQATSFKGLMQFTEMEPKNGKEADRWEKNRRLTYYGSQMHLLSALQQGISEEEGFLIYTTIEPGSSDKVQVEQPEALTHTVVNSNLTQLRVPRYLEITYTYETEEMGYVLETGRENASNQTSWLTILDSPAEFYPTGLLTNPHSIQSFGYWAWERVCDMLPIEYGVVP